METGTMNRVWASNPKKQICVRTVPMVQLGNPKKQQGRMVPSFVLETFPYMVQLGEN